MAKKYIFLILLFSLTFVNTKAQIVLNRSDTTICRGSTINNAAMLAVQPATNVTQGGDAIHATPFGQFADLGFNFEFFGNTYTQLRWGMDNFITLKAPNSLLASNISPFWAGYGGAMHIIDSLLKTAILLGFQDLEANAATGHGTVWVQWLGSPGSRKLVVDYCKVAQSPSYPGGYMYACSTNLVSNQVILYEGSNIIEFHTQNMPASNTCPYYSAGPNNAIQGLYYYDANNVAHQVYSPGRGPGDNWGAVGGQYTSRRFTPIANPPYYVVDTIPYNPWHIIENIDSTQFFWYDALGNQVSQGPALNAIATAPPEQDSTFFVAKYKGPAGCDTFANLTDTFWVHFAESDSTINAAICVGETYNFLGNPLHQAGVYDTVLSNHLGCDSVLTLNLSVHPLPEAVINGDNPAITCVGKLYYFSVDSLPGYAYQWYQNGIAIAGADSNAYGTATAGSYSVAVTSHLGCTQMSDTVQLQVMPLPEVTLSADKQNICAGDTVTLQADAQNMAKYEWYPKENFLKDSTAYTATEKAIVLNSGLLWVRVSDAYGCAGSDTVAIQTTPCCEVFMPTAFSPNHDGINDVFRPKLGPGRTVLEMKVFSRWGNSVYQCYSNNCDPWTGVDYLGRLSDIGVYFYYLKYKCADGNEYTVNGELTLVR